MRHSSKFFVASTLALMAALGAQADDFSAGKYGADAIFVAPIGAPISESSVRVSATLEAVEWENQAATVTFPVLEAMLGIKVGSGEVELTRAKAILLRAYLSHVMPLDFLSVYRNLDRGIDLGGDLVSVRVPIRVTPKGEVVIQPGLELGVRHYVAPVDKTTVNATFLLEARAAMTLVENFMSTGIMGRVRYDLNFTEMSGFGEEAMGYLSFLLDKDHRLYARIYVGIDDQQARENIGLPRTSVFTGVGINGKF